MRKPLALAVTAAMTTGLAAFVPAVANADAGSTPVTVTISGGSLAIAVDTAAKTLTGTATVTGATATGSLGSTTVSDSRAAGLSITVKASAPNFTGTGANTLNAAYGSVAATVTGTTGGILSAGVVTPATGNLATVGGGVFLTSPVTGSGTVTYNPVLTFTIPAASVVADTYTGSVTQTVS